MRERERERGRERERERERERGEGGRKGGYLVWVFLENQLSETERNQFEFK